MNTHSRFETYLDILQAAVKRGSPVGIAREANVPLSDTEKYLRFLASQGFLETAEREDEGIMYELTTRGFEVLDVLERFAEIGAGRKGVFRPGSVSESTEPYHKVAYTKEPGTVGVVIPARDEERYLWKTLEGLENQTASLDKVVLVNDGSTDSTREIAREFGALVVDLQDRGFRATGKPALAGVINAGLEYVEKADYVCVLGADHYLSSTYLFTISERMDEDPNLAVASGLVVGEWNRSPDFPAGSGRVIRSSFFREIGFRFPSTFGWEDWLIYKAKQLGYETRAFDDVPCWTPRPMRYVGKGEIMYALGYYWPYALGRCVKVFSKDPGAALNMLKGYLLHGDVEQLDDLAPWVRQTQKNRIKKMLRLKLRETEKGQVTPIQS